MSSATLTRASNFTLQRSGLAMLSPRPLSVSVSRKSGYKEAIENAAA